MTSAEVVKTSVNDDHTVYVVWHDSWNQTIYSFEFLEPLFSLALTKTSG